METEAAQDILARHLHSRGKSRATPERASILDEVMQSQGHFDAESLYYRLRSNGVKVSKATVYNTLDLLQECGLVTKYRFADKLSRYEKSFGKPHHHHLICLECGDIVEFVNEKLNRLQEEVCGEKEFTPNSSSVQIFGTCSRCRKVR
jgi:Fur family transcriptional regulator, ferric uptake regulator